jgi:peptidase A4-like protein
MKRSRPVAKMAAAAMAAFVAAMSSIALAQVFAQSVTSTTQPQCKAPFDVYKVPTEVSQRCGFRLFPRQSTTKLADGGMEYTYIVDGLRSVYRVPPPNTDLSLMTDPELASYGLPERPKDALTLADWTAQMSRRHQVTPPATLVEIPGDSASGCSGCWSGYLATSGSSSTYTFAEAIYAEPGVYGTSCSNNAAIFWAGLGGWGVSNLAQDGTSVNWSGFGQHQSWYEILPNHAVAEPVYGHPGYSFIAQLNRIGTTNGINFNLYDSYTGYGINFQVYGSGFDGSTADFVVERPQVSGQQQWLTNYVWVRFLQTYVNGTGPGHGVGSYPNTNISMYNGSDLLAYDAGLTNSGQSFNNYWNACS